MNQQIYTKLQRIIPINHVVGSIYTYIHKIKSYPSLNKSYQSILDENALLMREVLIQRATTASTLIDESATKQYACMPARVINNSIISTKNYLTIDKGIADGISPGMGVVSTQGIVGKVKIASEHFATIISLLHTDILVSAKIASSGVMGTIRWPGKNFCEAQLLYVPRHVVINPGDAVVTSGYNAIFCEGILIGHIKQIDLVEGALFYDIALQISTDFSTLQHVYVVRDSLQQERHSLEQYTKRSYE